MSCTIQDSLNERSVVILINVALFCHPIMVILNFVWILGCHILKIVSYTSVLSAMFDVVNTEDLLYTVFTFLCVFIAISCSSNCIASQHILIVTGSCETKKKILLFYLHRNKTTEKRINCSDMKNFMTHCVQYHINVGFGVASSLSIFLVHIVYFVWSVRVVHSCNSL